MLEPRIVAARIHGSAAFVHGAAAGLDRTKPSSHGCVKIFAIQPRLLQVYVVLESAYGFIEYFH